MLGGTQSLHCNGRDEALALPTEESARLALRTQQIIAAETGVANTVDPVGGSYAIETLTDEIERGADDAPRSGSSASGGTLAAIETGFIQREIQESAYRAQLAIDAGEAVVVGVNRFADRPAGPGVPLFRVDPEIGAAARSSACGPCGPAAARRVGGGSRARCRGRRSDGSNLVPPIIAAVEAQATVGEISDAMRVVFGEYQETATV